MKLFKHRCVSTNLLRFARRSIGVWNKLPQEVVTKSKSVLIGIEDWRSESQDLVFIVHYHTSRLQEQYSKVWKAEGKLRRGPIFNKEQLCWLRNLKWLCPTHKTTTGTLLIIRLPHRAAINSMVAKAHMRTSQILRYFLSRDPLRYTILHHFVNIPPKTTVSLLAMPK